MWLFCTLFEETFFLITRFFHKALGHFTVPLLPLFFPYHLFPIVKMLLLTCVPWLMSAPNHTGLFLEELHHTLRGMLDGLAVMQVSPVSMLQCTWMASSTLPWFGSTQYSPTQQNDQELWTCNFWPHPWFIWHDSDTYSISLTQGWAQTLFYSRHADKATCRCFHRLFFCYL